MLTAHGPQFGFVLTLRKYTRRSRYTPAERDDRASDHACPTDLRALNDALLPGLGCAKQAHLRQSCVTVERIDAVLLEPALHRPA